MLTIRHTNGEEIDRPLAMARDGQPWSYHTDHLGSTRLVTDAAPADKPETYWLAPKSRLSTQSDYGSRVL